MHPQPRTLALIACGAIAASSLTAAPRDKRRLNRHGAPVLTEDGRRLNYGMAEALAQAARVPPQGATALAVDRRDAAASAPSGVSIVPVWGFAGFGEGIGKTGIALADRSGALEIYLGASTSTFGEDDYWYILRYEPGAADYRQVHVSPRYATGIRRIAVADAVGDTDREVVVALRDGRVLLHDSQSRRVVAEIPTAANDLRGLGVRDVDGDGAPEILVCNQTQLFVYSPDGALEWQLPVGGWDLAVGQLDGDGALEIAVTDGTVVDASSRAAQWKWGAGFGRALELADIDGDGVEELIAAEQWYIVWSYDVDLQLPKWSIPIDLDIGAIHVGDVDDDGVVELLVGEGQWGEILAFDTVSRALEWSIGNPEHGVTAVAFGDVDGDGEVEVLWGAGATSTGADRLYVADPASGLIAWENVQLDGPFLGPKRGDLDGDGTPEIVSVSWESDAGYGSGRIVVLDAALRLRAISDGIVGDFALTGTHDLELRDVDADGRLEILVAADRLYDGVIEIYDFEPDDSFVLNWTNAVQPDGAPFYSVDAADVDGDGEMEIVGGGGREHTGAEGVFVYVYDYATASEEWHSIQMGDYWDEIVGLRLGDFDLDGSLEIAGIVNGGDAYVYDGPTQTLEDILSGGYTYLTSVTTSGAPYLLFGDANGDVVAQAFVSSSYVEVYRQSHESGPVEGVHLGWNRRSLWTASGGFLRLAQPATLSWRSDDYGQGFGRDVLFHPALPFLISGGGYGLTGFWLVTR